MIKKIIICTIILLVSAVTPMVLGYNSETKNSELSKNMDNLYACYCFDKYNPSGVFSRERFFLMDSYNSDFKSGRELDVPEHTAETGLNKMIKRESTVTDDGPMDSAWPMFCHDVRHTGRSPFGVKGTGVEKWKLNLSTGLISSSPAIDKDGTIYIGISPTTVIDTFYAINSDGTLKWGLNPNAWVHSSPAIAADGTIYFGCDDGHLYAINPNGSEKWRFNAGGEGHWVFSSPTIGNDGTIYVGSTNKHFYAVNPDGTLKWCYATGYKIYSSAAIDDNGIIYIGSHDHNLYAFYPNGTLKWKYKAGMEVKSPPAIGDNGTIYFCSWDNYVYAVNPDGVLKWKFATGDATETSPTIAPDGTIYVGSYNGKIFSISPNGTENWRFQTGDSVLSSPAIDKYGTIYFGSFDGNFYALNSDGNLKWKYEVGDYNYKYIEASPAIGEDGTIYFGSWNGYLYAIEVVETEPPEKPTITGPPSGKAGLEYTYTAFTIDQDGDNVSYWFDWGDDTDSSWTDFVSSGVTVNASHVWTEKGEYDIKVKAKDEFDAESDWAILEVSMPNNKAVNINPLFLRVLENHPYMFPILHRLIET